MKYSCPNCGGEKIVEVTSGHIATEVYSYDPSEDAWSYHNDCYTDTDKTTTNNYSCLSCGHIYKAASLDKVLQEMTVTRDMLLCPGCHVDLVTADIEIKVTSIYKGHMSAFFIDDLEHPFESVKNDMDAMEITSERHIFGHFFCNNCGTELPKASVENWQQLKKMFYNHEDIMEDVE